MPLNAHLSSSLPGVNILNFALIHHQGIISPPTRDFAMLKRHCLPARRASAFLSWSVLNIHVS
jgi:hypothetical protein